MIKGVIKILETGKNVKQFTEKMASDAIEDIDRRLNRPRNDPLVNDEEEDDETEVNALVEYCWGEIYGKNYGIRTLLEYEQECENAATCNEDNDINVSVNVEERNILWRERGNSIIKAFANKNNYDLQ